MMAVMDGQTVGLTAAILGVLVGATLLGIVLRRRGGRGSGEARGAIDNLNARIRAWWIMAAVFGVAIWLGPLGATLLFACISFLALREMLTLTPTRRADHHTLFWVLFIAIPVQYYLVYIEWYGLFIMFLPVYGYLFIAIRGTLAGDYHNYLARTAKIQWAVFICIYCVSHAPALLALNIPGYSSHPWKLLVFLVIVVQGSDVLQYAWGKLAGRHPIAPHISPHKTWEGFAGGVLSATALAVAMEPLTPFTPLEAGVIGLTVALMGFFGGLVMSAIKRDAGVKDYGHLIEGHGGMMDRIDSLTFAAPVFFHIVRYWFART
jgi:phosphatidate cytidylyltransferase